MLFTASPRRLLAADPKRFSHAWLGVMGLSLAWGLLAAGLAEGAFRVVGDYSGLSLIPVASVLAPMALWWYRRAVISLSEVVSSDAPALGASVILIVMALAMLNLRRGGDFLYHNFNTPAWLDVKVMYRVLILAPLWGAWAMLITGQFCRSCSRTEPAVAAFARGCGPAWAAVSLVVPLVATIMSFNYMQWTQLSISIAAAVTAVASGIVFCRIGGLTRRSLLAANLLTQIAFMLAYLANR